MVQLRAVQACDVHRATCNGQHALHCNRRCATDSVQRAMAEPRQSRSCAGRAAATPPRAARCILARWPAVRARRALHVVWCVGSARPHGSHRAPLSQPGRHVLTKSRCRIVRWKARLAHPYSATPPWPTQAQTRALPPMQGCVVPCGTGWYCGYRRSGSTGSRAGTSSSGGGGSCAKHACAQCPLPRRSRPCSTGVPVAWCTAASAVPWHRPAAC